MPESADHGLGRSRGGLTTKVHLACEQGQKPLSIVITARQRDDSPQFVPVLAGIRVPRIGSGRLTRLDLVRLAAVCGARAAGEVCLLEAVRMGLAHRVAANLLHRRLDFGTVRP